MSSVLHFLLPEGHIFGDPFALATISIAIVSVIVENEPFLLTWLSSSWGG